MRTTRGTPMAIGGVPSTANWQGRSPYRTGFDRDDVLRLANEWVGGILTPAGRTEIRARGSSGRWTS